MRVYFIKMNIVKTENSISVQFEQPAIVSQIYCRPVERKGEYEC